MAAVDNECYGDHDIEKDREFCVRDIPPNVDEWSIFHIFRRFGIVDHVRFPVHQPADAPRYCFVAMINHEGAANVRAFASNGKLNIGNVFLRISDARGGNQYFKKNHPRSSRGGGRPDSYQPRRSNEHKQDKHNAIRYPSADLPLNETVTVKVVSSPFASNEKEGLTFHILNCAKVPSEAYTELQQAMNTHCHNPDNVCGSVEIGTPIMFYRDDVAYRAIQNQTDTVYLVDMGREERIISGRLYRMPKKFAVLPSLVITCSLARVNWTKPSAELYTSVRQIVKKWCDSEKGLHATLEYFVGEINMVHLEGSGNTNLAKSLAKRGDLTVVEKLPGCTYSRDEFYRIKEEVSKEQCSVDISRHADGIRLCKAMDDLVI